MLTAVTGRSPSSFETHQTNRGHTANADPKLIFSAPVPLNRVDVAVHTYSEDHPLAKMGKYASDSLCGSDNQSQDKPLVPGIGSDVENGVQRG
jgi:hypothetical protein